MHATPTTSGGMEHELCFAAQWGYQSVRYCIFEGLLRKSVQHRLSGCRSNFAPLGIVQTRNLFERLRVAFYIVCKKACPLAFIRNDYVHKWAPRLVGKRNGTGSHKFDDADPKMLFFHCVKADNCPA
mmetsp:Transcript_86805/g.190603  ORF Transcript_86805/g.190603 Transcript_86805/m.190603 type:complete len:127 (-) Transcript_86805:1213-1593(-)